MLTAAVAIGNQWWSHVMEVITCQARARVIRTRVIQRCPGSQVRCQKRLPLNWIQIIDRLPTKDDRKCKVNPNCFLLRCHQSFRLIVKSKLTVYLQLHSGLFVKSQLYVFLQLYNGLYQSVYIYAKLVTLLQHVHCITD